MPVVRQNLRHVRMFWVGELLASLLLAGAVAAEAPKPHHAPKLVILNDDGFSSFFSGRYKTAGDLREHVLGLKDTHVAVFEWCIAAGSRVNYPSHVSELIGSRIADRAW